MTGGSPQHAAGAKQELEALDRLAGRHGIVVAHENTAGRVQHADPEVLVGVLRALDVDITHPDQALALLGASTPPEPIVDPVVVVDAERPSRVPVRHRPARTGWTLLEETSGEVILEGTISGDHIELGSLPVGFFTLQIETPSGVDEPSRVLSAPSKSFSDFRHSWGAFAPLYAVRRADSPGHLGDIRTLADAIAPWGGRTVAVLPLLATFLGDDPFEPSPYQPVSRRWFSELYLDPDRLPTGRPLDLPPAPPDADDFVDYRAWQQRAEAIVKSVRDSLATYPEAEAEFAEFCSLVPDVEPYARFRAAIDRHGSRPTADTGDLDPERFAHHATAQWLLHRQLTELRRDLADHGQALVLDLPVGSHPDGYDRFRRPDLYAAASVGAPPDDFFAGGQNWGFPPPHPERSRADGHRVLTDPAAVLAGYAGVLRVDHVIGLNRLWWIPEGGRADEGAYVRYELEEQLAALAIISHLHGSVVVGENLGTVPPEVTSAMAQRAVLGMHEEQFVIGNPPSDALPAIEPATVAGINTHDMPPFAGFAISSDLELRHELGYLDEDQLVEEQRSRHVGMARYRQLVADELERPVADDADSVLVAAVERLANSPAEQVMVTLEDLWGETNPQNVPGTHTEVPNWRRRMARALDEPFDGPLATAVLGTLATARPAESRPLAPPRRPHQ